MDFGKLNRVPGNLCDALRMAADTGKGITFISGTGERRLTYAELLESARAGSARLRARGLLPGNEVVLLIKDSEAFLRAFWACLMGGFVAVPLEVRRNPDHIAKVFKVWEKLEKRWLCTDEDASQSLEEYAATFGFSAQWAEMQERRIPVFPFETNSGFPDRNTSPGERAFIQFSSGTTGDPKGVVLSHRNLIANLMGIVGHIGYRDHERSLSWLPLTHDMGMVGFHLAPMAAGLDQFLMPPEGFLRNPLKWLEKASEHCIQYTGCPNFGIKYFLQHFQPVRPREMDLSGIRLIFNGAEQISPSLCEAFARALSSFGLRREALYGVYGLAEATLAVTLPPTGERLRKLTVDRRYIDLGVSIVPVPSDNPNALELAEVGLPIGDTSIQVRDNEGRPAGEGVLGTLWIRGSSITAGYYRDSSTVQGGPDEEGWLDTGDAGFLLHGRLVITGRIKDVVCCNGRKFFCHDVENAVTSALPESHVCRAAVVGVLVPAFREEKVALFLETKSTDWPALAAIALDVKSSLLVNLSLEVSCVVPVPSFPRTTSGKVQRYKLKTEFQQGEFTATLRHMAEAGFLGPADGDLIAVKADEIEEAICAYGAVADAAVKLWGSEVQNGFLAGYYVLRSGRHATPEDIRAHLRERLPEHILPSAYLELERMPTNDKGKLDRFALPPPTDPDSLPFRSNHPPRSETECMLAEIWAGLLGRRNVGTQDDFFRLGGNSLKMVLMCMRVEERSGLKLGLKEVYEHPVLGTLARYLDGIRAQGFETGFRIPKRPAGMDAPIGFQQEMRWNQFRESGKSSFHNLVACLEYLTTTDTGLVLKTLGLLFERHAALRTCFRVDGQREIQIAIGASEVVPNAIFRRRIPAGVPFDALDAIREEARHEFDLVKAPLARFVIFEDDTRPRYLLLNIHHIVADGWSLKVLAGDFRAIYEDLAAGRSLSLPPLDLEYADFAHWERGLAAEGGFSRSIEYFRARLATLPAFPAYLAPEGNNRASATRSLAFHMDRAAAEGIRKSCRDQGITPYVFFLTLLKAAFLDALSVEEIVVAIPLDNRTNAETERVVGPFNNFILMKTGRHGSEPLELMAKRVHLELASASEHRHVPYRVVREHINYGKGNLWHLLFNQNDALAMEENFPGEMGKPFFSVIATPPPDALQPQFIVGSVTESQEGFALSMVFDARIYSSLMLEDAWARFGALLRRPGVSDANACHV